MAERVSPATFDVGYKPFAPVSDFAGLAGRRQAVQAFEAVSSDMARKAAASNAAARVALGQQELLAKQAQNSIAAEQAQQRIWQDQQRLEHNTAMEVQKLDMERRLMPLKEAGLAAELEGRQIDNQYAVERHEAEITRLNTVNAQNAQALAKVKEENAELVLVEKDAERFRKWIDDGNDPDDFRRTPFKTQRAIAAWKAVDEDISGSEAARAIDKKNDDDFNSYRSAVKVNPAVEGLFNARDAKGKLRYRVTASDGGDTSTFNDVGRDLLNRISRQQSLGLTAAERDSFDQLPFYLLETIEGVHVLTRKGYDHVKSLREASKPVTVVTEQTVVNVPGEPPKITEKRRLLSELVRERQAEMRNQYESDPDNPPVTPQLEAQWYDDALFEVAGVALKQDKNLNLISSQSDIDRIRQSGKRPYIWIQGDDGKPRRKWLNPRDLVGGATPPATDPAAQLGANFPILFGQAPAAPAAPEGDRGLATEGQRLAAASFGDGKENNPQRILVRAFKSPGIEGFNLKNNVPFSTEITKLSQDNYNKKVAAHLGDHYNKLTGSKTGVRIDGSPMPPGTKGLGASDGLAQWILGYAMMQDTRKDTTSGKSLKAGSNTDKLLEGVLQHYAHDMNEAIINPMFSLARQMSLTGGPALGDKHQLTIGKPSSPGWRATTYSDWTYNNMGQIGMTFHLGKMAANDQIKNLMKKPDKDWVEKGSKKNPHRGRIRIDMQKMPGVGNFGDWGESDTRGRGFLEVPGMANTHFYWRFTEEDVKSGAIARFKEIMLKTYEMQERLNKINRLTRAGAHGNSFPIDPKY